jgi:GxxExxY protein
LAEGLADGAQARLVDDVTRGVLEASEQVRAELGPTLEPLAFRTFLAHELRLRGLSVVEDVAVAESYKGKVVDDAYRVDMLVEGAVIVDVGRTELSQEEHEARLRKLMTGVGAVAGVLVSRQAGEGGAPRRS